MTTETTGGELATQQRGEPTIASLTGVTARTTGAGMFRTVDFTFTDYALPLVDAAGVVAYAGVKLLDCPTGGVHLVGALATLAVTKSSAGVNANFDGDFAMGTVTASNNGTLASTEQTIIPTTATPQAASGATTAKGVMTTPLVYDGTTTACPVFLNFLVDDADHDVTTTPCSLILNGTVTVSYVFMGAY